MKPAALPLLKIKIGSSSPEPKFSPKAIPRHIQDRLYSDLLESDNSIKALNPQARKPKSSILQIVKTGHAKLFPESPRFHQVSPGSKSPTKKQDSTPKNLTEKVNVESQLKLLRKSERDVDRKQKKTLRLSHNAKKKNLQISGQQINEKISSGMRRYSLTRHTMTEDLDKGQSIFAGMPKNGSRPRGIVPDEVS
jgi:hypothetical protein